jgi:HD-GYP domain-containing protein (c-di-GMP phosphodiesterase class II)
MTTESWDNLNHPILTVENNPDRRWIPIRLKITVPYMLLALALALGAMYIVFQVVFDTIEERFENQLVETGRLASERIAREELARMETLRLLTNLKGFSSAVQARDAERLRELTFGIVVNNQEEAVEIIDSQGRLIVSMRRRPGGNPEDYVFSKHGEAIFIDWAFVKPVLEGRQDQPGDRYSGVVQSDWGNYFYIAAPVLGENKEILGAVLIGKSLSKLAVQIREETLAQVTFYNREGTPLSSTHAEVTPIRHSDLEMILSSAQDGSLLRSGIFSLNVEYDELIGPWEGRGKQELGLMGVSMAKSFLVKAGRFTRIRISLLFSAGFLLVIFLGVYLANYITQPLYELMGACKRVAQGDLKVQVPPSSNDELATLAESFNSMVNNLGRTKEDLVNAYDNTLEGWAHALELRDKETEGHTQRAVNLTLQIARRMGFPEESLVDVRRGVLLHDIGKMGIPDSILLKPGPLSKEEWTIMRKHPDYAVKMLSHIEFLKPALNIPHAHHERWDGTGYPRQLKGDEIPMEARIFAVVDVWDAIRSERPYRRAISRENAIHIIQEGSGTHFDPVVVQHFLSLLQGNGSGSTEE